VCEQVQVIALTWPLSISSACVYVLAEGTFLRSDLSNSELTNSRAWDVQFIS